MNNLNIEEIEELQNVENTEHQTVEVPQVSENISENNINQALNDNQVPIDERINPQQIEELRNELQLINLELKNIIQIMNDTSMTEYEIQQLQLLQELTQTETIIKPSETEIIYQEVQFYSNLSIIVILSLITIAMTWKFVHSVFSTFTRHIG